MPSLNEISQKYENLVPSRFLGLIVIQLYRKIEGDEINPIFSIREVEGCVEQVKKLLSSRESAHLEHWLQRLLPIYLDQPPNKFDEYTLTEYARRFAQLVIEKLENPYKGLPLASTFQKYFMIEPDQIQSVSELREWYVFGFEETVRKAVHQHLEALQDSVNEQLEELQALLDLEELEAQKKIRQFTLVFAQLAFKAKDLSESLELAMNTLRSLSIITELFENRVQKGKGSELENLVTDFEDVRVIKLKVRDFFDKIDLGMELVQAQISHASSKLSELQENFKERALFKIRLKKFYSNLLSKSSINRLPDGFKRGNIACKKIKHNSITYYDFEIITKHPGIVRSAENEYSFQERKKVEMSMFVQERTNHWVKTLSNLLDLGEAINFEKNFFEILLAERNLEIPIQVGHGLIQMAQHKSKWKLEIKKELQTNSLHENISLWKVLLKPI